MLQFITKGSQDWNSSLSGSRSWCRGHRGMLLTGLVPLACSACSLIEPKSTSPKVKLPTLRSRGLSPWREPMRGYWWSLITVEDSSVLEMPVPCDDHQEQQQQWSTGSWSLEDKLCATKGRAGEVTQALGGAQKIMSWIPDIGHLEFEFCFWLWLCPDMFPSWRKKVF